MDNSTAVFETRRSRLLPLAVLAGNALFFLIVFSLFSCRLLNDDLAAASFVNDAWASPDLHLPYQSVLHAALLRGLYVLFGTGLQWLVLWQYALLVLSWSALCLFLLKKHGLLRGLALDLLLLAGFGFVSYLRTSYTMTAGVAACAGMLLLLQGAEASGRGEKPAPASMAAGLLLCAAALALRRSIALPCFALLLPTALPFARTLSSANGFDFRRALRFAAPLLLLGAITLVLLGADRAFWRAEPYAHWEEFNESRTQVLDFSGLIPYEEAPEAYAEAGIRKSELALLSYYDYQISDPEIFTAEFFRRVLAVSRTSTEAPTLLQVLGRLGAHLARSMVSQPYFAALALLLLLRLAGGRRVRDAGAALAWVGLFLLLYLYLVVRGRWGLERVDHGLALSGFLVLAAFPSPGGKWEKPLAVLFLAGLCFTMLLCHPRSELRRNSPVPAHRLDSIYSALCADEEHVFLDAQLLYCGSLRDPLYCAPEGAYDRVIPLCGWIAQHPIQRAALERQGLADPYRDCVGREDVCWISDEIDLVVNYIREHYAPDARAERLETLSAETGLSIYWIKEN